MHSCGIFHGAEKIKKILTQALETLMHTETSGRALKAKMRALVSSESHVEGFRGHLKSLEI